MSIPLEQGLRPGASLNSLTPDRFYEHSIRTRIKTNLGISYTLSTHYSMSIPLEQGLRPQLSSKRIPGVTIL